MVHRKVFILKIIRRTIQRTNQIEKERDTRGKQKRKGKRRNKVEEREEGEGRDSGRRKRTGVFHPNQGAVTGSRCLNKARQNVCVTPNQLPKSDLRGEDCSLLKLTKTDLHPVDKIATVIYFLCA